MLLKRLLINVLMLYVHVLITKPERLVFIQKSSTDYRKHSNEEHKLTYYWHTTRQSPPLLGKKVNKFSQ